MLVELGRPKKASEVKGKISVVSGELLSLRKPPLKDTQAMDPAGSRRRRQTSKGITDLQEPEH